MAKIACFIGTFDPVTNGHTDIIMRASTVFDQLIVGVTNNANKQSVFSISERLSLLTSVLSAHPKISIKMYSGLTVNFMHECGATVLVRGLRTVSDFDPEYRMAMTNQALSSAVETVFLPASPAATHITSSLVREIASLKGDLSAFVHPAVACALKDKYKLLT